MALLVGVSTFVLLFLAFGSVVLPVKAIVMNVLSLSATFGVVVWIFQWVLLVPATMRLLGRANWWAPRPLRWLYARYGIREEIHAERAEVPV